MQLMPVICQNLLLLMTYHQTDDASIQIKKHLQLSSFSMQVSFKKEKNVLQLLLIGKQRR